MENATLDRKRVLLEYGKKFEIGGEYGNFDGMKMKSKGGKKGLLLNIEELKYWNIMNEEIQMKICKYKYENDERIKEVLNGSKGRILIHPALRVSLENVKKRKWEGRDVIDEGKIVVYGSNNLGYIWMKLRDQVENEIV